MNIFNFKNRLETKLIVAMTSIILVSPTANAMFSASSFSDDQSYYVVVHNQYLLRAAKRGSVPDIDFAIRNGATDRESALCIAIKYGNRGVVEYLLSSGKISPNAIGRALCVAAQYDRCNLISRLISSGEVLSEDMGKALCVAVENNHYLFASLLSTWYEEHPDAVECALSIARTSNIYDIVEPLLAPDTAKGIDPNDMLSS